MNPFKKIFLLVIFLLFYLLANISTGDEEGGHMHGSEGEGISTGSGKGPTIHEYTIPTPYSQPVGIAVDSKDNVWFTAQSSHRLVKFDPSKSTFKEYDLPSVKELPKTDWKYSPNEKVPPKEAFDVRAIGGPGAIIVDRNDKIWFLELLGNKIDFFDPDTEKFTEYKIPTQNSQPHDLSIDSKGNLWFIEWNSGNLGKLDNNSKKITEYTLKDVTSRLSNLVIDTDDNIWVSDHANNEIGKFDIKEKKYKPFPIGTRNSKPGKLLIDSSKNIWFAETSGRKIAMLLPATGIISEAPLPGYNSAPYGIIFDKKGRLWYIDNMRNKIGFFDIETALFNEFDIPTVNSQPMNMAIDSKGDIWFTEAERGANKIARLVMSTVPEIATAKPDESEGIQEVSAEGQGAEDVNRIPFWVYSSVILLGVAIIMAIFLLKKKRV
jgi:streptogramin lyase